jgi:hypothetical protein
LRREGRGIEREAEQKDRNKGETKREGGKEVRERNRERERKIYLQTMYRDQFEHLRHHLSWSQMTKLFTTETGKIGHHF